jgi:hypothetical protein
VYYQNNQVYLGVDYTTSNPTGGRASVRLSSNQAFSEILSLCQLSQGQSLTSFYSPRSVHSRHNAHARRNLWHMACLLDVWCKFSLPPRSSQAY